MATQHVQVWRESSSPPMLATARARRLVAASRPLPIRLVEPDAAVRAPYLEGLNACFPGWGDGVSFDWCFQRTAGAAPADLFVAEEDGRLIAGSAITYRMFRRPDGGVEPVGCMTGSWTLRAARGRGLFQRMIEDSKMQARRRGCRLLIAFASAGKASRPGLLAAGAVPIEAAFLASPDDGPTAALERAGVDAAVAAFAGRGPEGGSLSIAYRAGDWRGQMVDRPHPVECWRLGDGLIAVVERTGTGVDRLLDVSCRGREPFLAAVERAAALSRSAGRRLSVYSLDQAVIAALAGRGFTESRAWFYVMTTGTEPPPTASWWFANGDRM